ncbi:MAG TPA: hypothetical protein VE178_20160, partial [Silvibacterium sp.]|nr:hypothetical protein [Silvibacterium sp.]
MKTVAVLFALQGLPIVLAFFAFIYERAGWKCRKRLGKRRGFYPTTFALGIAFQQIQLFVAPSMDHTIAEKLKEEAEEDDEGGPDNPARHLDRQLKRIRRGERIDTLTTLLPNRD